MEDGTRTRSLHAVLAIATGIILIGAGCSGTPETPPPPSVSAPQVQAPAPQTAKSPAFVSCYHGEADLFSSVSSVSDKWVDEVHAQIQNGWVIDTWCREQDENGTPKYAFAFKKSQGITADDLATTKQTYQKSGHQKQAPVVKSDEDMSQWTLEMLGYVPSGRNRANEIPLQLSDAVAVRNGGSGVDGITFLRDLTDVAEAPRSVAAEMHGGDALGRFAVRFSYNPNSNTLKTDAYCHTYFETDDGSFAPDALKTSCE